ncbi:MAG: PHP domain-containing protein [Synergistaceae bacterium]|nr:PHP domain-containing protein [Synergistaceae bacterium]
MRGGLKNFWVDLHLHTVLSPCGELEMGALGIVARAREAGIDVIAVCDHNTCDNFTALEQAADGSPAILPGIEVQTAEDIHVVTVFPRYEVAHKFKEWLWLKMPSVRNDPEVFGYQVVVDGRDDIVRMEDTLLIQGAGYDVDTVVSYANGLGAITVLAHVDRPAFSYPAVLGPFTENYPVDAIELSCRLDSAQAEEWREKYPSRTFLRSSDSHTLDTISRENCTKMLLAAPDFDEIMMAVHGKGRRRVYWPWG